MGIIHLKRCSGTGAKDNSRHDGSTDVNDNANTLGAVVSRDYQAYRLTRFDEDPNIFEGLSVFSRRPVEDDDAGG